MEAGTAAELTEGLPCCYCDAKLTSRMRYGVTEDGRNVCRRCIAARRPDLLTMHEPERTPDDRDHLPPD